MIDSVICIIKGTCSHSPLITLGHLAGSHAKWLLNWRVWLFSSMYTVMYSNVTNALADSGGCLILEVQIFQPWMILYLRWAWHSGLHYIATGLCVILCFSAPHGPRAECALIHLLILALYKLFVCLPSLLPDSLYFLPYLCTSLLVYFLNYLSTSSRICPICFQVGGHKRQPNLALFFGFILCCAIGSFLCSSIFCYRCIFLLLCLFQFFSTKPSDWLGRTSPKWPNLCRVGRKP